MDEQVFWDPKGVRELVIAIMEQGVEDVLKGDPGAIAWLDSRGFDHWCAWLGLDTTAARQAIHARRAERQPKYKPEDLRRVKQLHDKGVPWRWAMVEVFGYYSETLRTTIKRYDAMQQQTAAGRSA